MSAVVKGWCPSLQRPMASGDGLIARIKPSAGRLPAAAARLLAGLASRYGHGTIELTQRGNIQLRGIDSADYNLISEEVTSSGLAAPDEAAEAVRNIQCSPFGPAEDASAAFDPLPIAMTLEEALLADMALHALPGKFGFAVDGGGGFGLGITQADIGLKPGLVPDQITLEAAGHAVHLPHEEAVAGALALAHAFLTLSRRSGSTSRRLKSLTQEIDVAEIFGAAGFPAPRLQRPRAPQQPCLGLQRLKQGMALAIAPAFGRLPASALLSLADFARQQGDGVLRLGANRSLLITGLSNEAAYEALTLASRLELIVSADDPRLKIDVCTGAPGCPQAEAPTLTLAATLAAALPERINSLHLSGCAKGCARPRPATLTLTARGGRFNAIRNGMAGDEPFASALQEAELVQFIQSFAAERQDRT
ncbi:precorrin-3B synthase [Radicibacter daui]|uniref:precorrin-3B synthase n=1 Tax=Radicibacter daui TaxID=3064829 RepID=UPI004046F371